MARSKPLYPWVAACLAGLLLFAPTLWAEPVTTLSEALNQSGRQRMLTQRMVKAYGLLLLDIEYDDHEHQLQDAIALFEEQLGNLKAYAPNQDLTAQLNLVDGLWQPFKALVQEEPNHAGLEKLIVSNEELLAQSHKAVGLFEALATKPAGRLVNVAGRQRMLSQRIAKFYVLRSLGYQTEQNLAAIQQAASEFREAMTFLGGSAENTAEIKGELKKVNTQWLVFEAGFRSMQKGDYAPLMIARYSEKVLQGMNHTTGLYAQLASE